MHQHPRVDIQYWRRFGRGGGLLEEEVDYPTKVEASVGPLAVELHVRI